MADNPSAVVFGNRALSDKLFELMRDKRIEGLDDAAGLRMLLQWCKDQAQRCEDANDKYIRSQLDIRKYCMDVRALFRENEPIDTLDMVKAVICRVVDDSEKTFDGYAGVFGLPLLERLPYAFQVLTGKRWF